MKLKTALFGLALLASVSGPAFSAATPEEAQRLTEVFQTYLGKEPGVVTVTPEVDSYRARFDAAPLFAKMNVPAAVISMSAYETLITPQSDGKWLLKTDQPLSVTFNIEGSLDFRLNIGSYTSTDIFDERLGFFSSTDAVMTEVVMDQKLVEASQQNHTVTKLDKVIWKATAAGMNGVGNTEVNVSFSSLRQNQTTTSTAGGAPQTLEFLLTSTDGVQVSKSSGVRARAVYDLLAWMVVNPSKAAAVADQAGLKSRLRDIIPFFDSTTGTLTLNNLTHTSIAGSFSAKEMKVDVDMNGIVRDGYLRERFSFSGIGLPPEIVPPWASGLVPEAVVLDFNVSKFDLAAAANLSIDRLDLAKSPPLPEGFGEELIKALMPAGTVQLGLGPSEILAKAFRLNAEGSMTAGPAAMPAGKALLKLTGMDKLIAALQSAPPEMDMQNLAPVLFMIQGLAKQEADGTLSWAIETTPTGSVTVNGTDLTKMMGGQ